MTCIKISCIVHHLSGKKYSAYHGLWAFKVKWSKLHGLPLYITNFCVDMLQTLLLKLTFIAHEAYSAIQNPPSSLQSRALNVEV